MNSLFQFTLKPIEECAISSAKDLMRICWYFLTDSFYHIDLGDTVLYEYSEIQKKKHESGKYTDYYFGRIIEDMLDIFHTILKPIPSHIFQYFKDTPTAFELKEQLSRWFISNENLSNELQQQYQLVDNFFGNHFLDTSYYRVKNHISFFNVDNKIHIQYDFLDFDEQGELIWGATSGSYVIPCSQFESDIRNTVFSFFEAMEKQITKAKNVISKTHCKSNTTEEINNLIFLILEENQLRKQKYFDLLNNYQANETLDNYYWERLDHALLWAINI